MAREHGSLAKFAGKYRRFKSLVEEVAGLRKMANGHDAEEQELAAPNYPASLPIAKPPGKKSWR